MKIFLWLAKYQACNRLSYLETVRFALIAIKLTIPFKNSLFFENGIQVLYTCEYTKTSWAENTLNQVIWHTVEGMAIHQRDKHCAACVHTLHGIGYISIAMTTNMYSTLAHRLPTMWCCGRWQGLKGMWACGKITAKASKMLLLSYVWHNFLHSFPSNTCSYYDNYPHNHSNGYKECHQYISSIARGIWDFLPVAGGGTNEALRSWLAIEVLAALRWASCVEDIGDCSDDICEITI